MVWLKCTQTLDKPGRYHGCITEIGEGLRMGRGPEEVLGTWQGTYGLGIRTRTGL